MEKRTERIQVWLTPEELDSIRTKSRNFNSISNYIRCAVAEYSNINARTRYEVMTDLGNYYREFRNDFSWLGSNLNQIAKRTNELGKAGILSQAYITEVILPAVKEATDILTQIQRGLLSVTKKAQRL